MLRAILAHRVIMSDLAQEPEYDENQVAHALMPNEYRKTAEPGVKLTVVYRDNEDRRRARRPHGRHVRPGRYADIPGSARLHRKAARPGSAGAIHSIRPLAGPSGVRD